jgi:purine catabolism regulator
MLSVRELLAGVDVQVRAGEAGLDHPVRWVHVSELVDPTRWLSGGEVLLTTGLQLTDAPTQTAFVARLAEHGLAGLGFGTGFGHPEVPAAILAEATARDFPLFEVPYALPFIALTERAFGRVVNEQYEVLRRSVAAQERLQRIVLSERGLEAVAGALATYVGGTIVVLDARGERLAHQSYRRPLPDDAVERLAAGLADATGDPAGVVAGDRELASRALALPVVAGGDGGEATRPQAWLVAVKDAGGLTDFDRLLLGQGVTAVAFELLRLRVADTTTRRLAGDVLSAMAGGELTGADLARRLEPFGLGGRVAALVLAPADPRDALAPLEAATEAAVRRASLPGLVAVHGGLVCALLPGTGDEELFALAERLQATIAPDGGVRGGVGRAVPAGRARETFHEARCALEALALGHVGGQPDGNGNGALHTRPATYRDLGSFSLLLSLQDSDALRLFCESMLGPIEADEGVYGDELVRSLEAYIECNGQWEAAARRLPCHRHTLRYRMRKVEELTGRDLTSARDRIEFWLALRGRELIVTTETSTRGQGR